MSNLRGSLDYLKLIGAKVCAIEIEGKAVNGVFLPSDWNDIKITLDNNGKPNAAYQNVFLPETTDAYRKACVERNSTKDDFVAPSHHLHISYSQDYKTAFLPNYIAQVEGDTVFMGTNPSEEDISKQAGYKMRDRSRIGTITPIRAKEFAGTAPIATTQAFTAPAPGETGHVAPSDDLPF